MNFNVPNISLIIYILYYKNSAFITINFVVINLHNQIIISLMSILCT